MSKNFIHEQASKQGSKVMSTAIASEYVRRMVERETAGNGDVENAIRRLARKHGLSFWQIMHLRAGRAKTITIDAFITIRGAYLDYCEQQISDLRREVEEVRGQNASFENLADEVEALAEKVRRAKGR
jgi:type II secretory pathway component PulM